MLLSSSAASRPMARSLPDYGNRARCARRFTDCDVGVDRRSGQISQPSGDCPPRECGWGPSIVPPISRKWCIRGSICGTGWTNTQHGKRKTSVRQMATSPTSRSLARPAVPNTIFWAVSSCLVAHRLPIKHRMVYRHGLLGDFEPRRDPHPSFRVADDCPDEFLRTTCRE